MGQKVNPIGFRLGINKTWESRWFRNAGYAEWLKEDLRIREFVKKNCESAGISRVEIERAADKCKVNIYNAQTVNIWGRPEERKSTV